MDWCFSPPKFGICSQFGSPVRHCRNVEFEHTEFYLVWHSTIVGGWLQFSSYCFGEGVLTLIASGQPSVEDHPKLLDCWFPGNPAIIWSFGGSLFLLDKKMDSDFSHGDFKFPFRAPSLKRTEMVLQWKYDGRNENICIDECHVINVNSGQYPWVTENIWRIDVREEWRERGALRDPGRQSSPRERLANLDLKSASVVRNERLYHLDEVAWKAELE